MAQGPLRIFAVSLIPSIENLMKSWLWSYSDPKTTLLITRMRSSMDFFPRPKFLRDDHLMAAKQEAVDVTVATGQLGTEGTMMFLIVTDLMSGMGFWALNSSRFPRRGNATGPGGKFLPLLVFRRRVMRHRAKQNRTKDPTMVPMSKQGPILFSQVKGLWTRSLRSWSTFFGQTNWNLLSSVTSTRKSSMRARPSPRHTRGPAMDILMKSWLWSYSDPKTTLLITMRSSMDFFPRPKFLRVLRAKRRWSLHWGLGSGMGFWALNSSRFPRRGNAIGPGGKFLPLLVFRRRVMRHRAKQNRTKDPTMVPVRPQLLQAEQPNTL
ncbi:hypothetical protein CRUP_020838 [Coryphaenoides rupestris]|nr:hypothetical protein CRUP_020838 [Coryphaenoides rupestris]